MRKPNVLRPVHLHTTLPEDVWLKLTAYLYSEIEGRVPKGAYQQFIIDRIVDFFNRKEPTSAEPGTPV